jgi:hypothetical protein
MPKRTGINSFDEPLFGHHSFSPPPGRKYSSAFLVGLAALSLTACAYDPYVAGRGKEGPGIQSYRHYEHYEPSLVQLARMRHAVQDGKAPTDDPFASYTIADIDVVNYADHVKAIFESKFTGSRFTGYFFSSAQSALAALSGIASLAATGGAASPALAFASAFTPDVAKLFNANGRTGAYQDAMAKIQQGEVDYLKARVAAENPTPDDKADPALSARIVPESELTNAGVTLYGVVTGNISVVEKFMSGQLPTLDEMKQAAGQKTDTEKAAKADAK